jgi:hypothetical protein
MEYRSRIHAASFPKAFCLAKPIALVLVGWALMIPPTYYTVPNTDKILFTPFGKDWLVVNNYNDGEECAKGLKFALTHEDELARIATLAGKSLEDAYKLEQYGGFCVADDDPRLGK